MSTPASTDDLCLLPLADLRSLLQRRLVSPVELIEATLKRIELYEPSLNSYLAVAGEESLVKAADAARDIAKGRQLGPLHGIPISLKDNIATTNMTTTAGSPLLAETWRPTQPATVVHRLEQAGAIVVGKSHMYELAYGAPHASYGEIRNPWDTRRTCGGSSSGSAASVAAGLCTGSIGTDTGGSIRIPAAFCGVVGLKPTYGRVSRFGVVPVSANLDHVGPLARTVSDAAILLSAIAGPDKRDATTTGLPCPELGRELEGSVRGLRLGVPAAQPSEAVDAEVRAAVDAAIAVLEHEGAKLSEVSLPDLAAVETAMWVITSSEIAAYYRDLIRTRGDEFHPLVLALLRQGESLQATDYVQAQRVRQKFVNETRAIFQDVDAVVLPTTAIAAFHVGEETVRVGDHDEHVQPAMNRYTPLFNLTGQPALSVPCGFNSHGMPLALQLGGRAFDEATILRLARAYERETDWSTRHPTPMTQPT